MKITGRKGNKGIFNIFSAILFTDERLIKN